MDLNTRNKSVIGVMFDKQPYEAKISGINVTVCKGAFPSDLGLTTEYLIDVSKKYNPKTALDMGCGLGVIAIALKKMGVPEVWAVDYHKPAIDCATKNAERHQNFGPIHIVHSDLFSEVPKGKQFDLMVFNQPYAPENSGKRRFGNDGKGGREVIERFIGQALEYLTPDGKILMPYSELVDIEHSPEVVSREFNLKAEKVFQTKDSEHMEHTIFEFSKK